MERTNKVIKTAINQYLEKSQKKWDALLPELVFAYNSAASDSTGYTPAYLNYGRELISLREVCTRNKGDDRTSRSRTGYDGSRRRWSWLARNWPRVSRNSRSITICAAVTGPQQKGIRS